MDAYATAIQHIARLIRRAQHTALHEPTTAVLATADRTGRPSVRAVLVKSVDPMGLVFYTSLRSRKAQQLRRNPRAALCLFWDPLMRQILIEGRVERVAEAEADAYWASRPRTHQLGAWASRQSARLASRAVLERRFAAARRRFAGRPVPRPPSWSGFRLIPNRIEFWRARPFRLNERILYQRVGRRWATRLLYP